MFHAFVIALALGLAPQTVPPDTPGTVALLATRPSSEIETALRTAIASPDPDVRAVAARAVAVTGQLALVQAVVDALSNEQHPVAAAEQARTVLLLRGAVAMSLVEPHATRVGGAALVTVSDWQARHEKPQGGTVLPEAGSMRTPEVWLPGLLASTAAAAGCPVSNKPLVGVARLTYRGDGRHSNIDLDPLDLPKECRIVLNALARLSLAEADRRISDGQTQWLILPISQKHLACTALHDPPAVRVGGAVKAPVKTKDARPQYPEALQRTLVQGDVVMEGWISSTGCVRSARVFKSADPRLDFSAVRAVLQWEFTPTLLDGKAVPALMTVTVSFSLR